MIIIQQQERESKQQELIVLARKEEQLAKEKLERKKRMGEQMEKFAPLQNKIQENLNKVLQVWNSVDDKSFFSPALVQTVPKISQLSRSLLEEGRNKVGRKLPSVQPCFTKLYPPSTYRLLFNCRKTESIRVARQSCHVKKSSKR